MHNGAGCGGKGLRVVTSGRNFWGPWPELWMVIWYPWAELPEGAGPSLEPGVPELGLGKQGHF